jgi:hypothetical protein
MAHPDFDELRACIEREREWHDKRLKAAQSDAEGWARKCAVADERVVALEAFIAEFAAAKIEALRMPSVRSPEDEPDPAVDAEEVWAWQADARALLPKKEAR